MNKTKLRKGALLRNRWTGQEVGIEAINWRAGRVRLSCDAEGLVKDVGWTPEAVLKHWLLVGDPGGREEERT